jgi:hypothetical protein
LTRSSSIAGIGRLDHLAAEAAAERLHGLLLRVAPTLPEPNDHVTPRDIA